MYHSSNIVVGPQDLPEVRLNKGETSSFPVVDFADHVIQLRDSHRMPHAEQAAFLREWAKRLTDMAEILDALDAPHIAREQREADELARRNAAITAGRERLYGSREVSA